MADRDWGGLRNIIDQAIEDRRREELEPPVACPNDGEPLDIEGSVRNCPWGDYRWCG